MYSGMAVRTAVAIGLASGMSSLPANMWREGKRTWWYVVRIPFQSNKLTNAGVYIRMKCKTASRFERAS